MSSPSDGSTKLGLRNVDQFRSPDLSDLTWRLKLSKETGYYFLNQTKAGIFKLDMVNQENIFAISSEITLHSFIYFCAWRKALSFTHSPR